MVPIKYAGNSLWERIERVVETVEERLRRVARALNQADIPYAIVGGNAVHVVFAGKKASEEYPEPVPEIDECEWIEDTRTLPLESLVRMKLTSFRRKAQVHRSKGNRFFPLGPLQENS